MSLVEVTAVTKRFGSFTAVDGLDLSVAPGEVVGLLGANGAGKTTLLRMVLGLERPTSGLVLLFGGPPSRAARRRTGYVPQTLGLWDDLTVAENLAFSAGVFGVEPGSAPADTDLVLVGDLPLGLQRRVAFVAALQHHPDLLVLDEPTSGVAPLARARLWEDIRTQAGEGTAVIVTTHYMDEARQADRLVLMASGRVVGTGNESEIVGGAKAVVVRAGKWDEAFGALEDAGMPAALAGRDLRIPGVTEESVAAVLRGAGVVAETSTSSATLEEAMVLAGRR